LRGTVFLAGNEPAGGKYMQAEAILPELTEIEGLRGRIEGWRQSRPKSRPMPEELWQEAGEAAKRLGTGRVARALGLSYEGLKQRVISNGSGRHRGGERRHGQLERPEFIELNGFAALDPAVTRDEMVVEMVAADGTRLTIRVKGASPNISALIEAFRGRP
jgi:hypothetical protein